MALKAILDTLDGVDEGIRGYYVEQDGKHVLDVDGVDTHPQVANLKSAYERTKTDKTTTAAKLKELQTQLDEALKGKPDEAAMIKMRQEMESDLNTWKTKAGELEGQLTGVTRDRALTDALAAAGVTNPSFVKAATAMHSSAVKMDGGKAIIETDMGPLAIGDFIKRWAAGEGKDFVSAPSGGGAKGNQGGVAGKTMSRADFAKLDSVAQGATVKGGTKIVD